MAKKKPTDQMRIARQRAELESPETARAAEAEKPPKTPRQQYEEAARTSPQDFEAGRADVKDPAIDRMGDMLTYRPDGTMQYSPDLIQNQYYDLEYEIYQRGSDEPNQREEEADRARAAAVLAAYENNEREQKRKLIGIKQRRQLQAIAYGDQAAYDKAVSGIADRRRTGPRAAQRRARRELRKRSSFQTAAQADAAQQFKELNALGANRQYKAKKPKPQQTQMFTARETAGGRQTRQKFRQAPRGVLEMEDRRTAEQKAEDERKAEEALTYKMEI